MYKAQTGTPEGYHEGFKTSKYLYYITLTALVAGIFLTILSWMDLCSGACVAGHKYRLYGIKFEYLGFAFFNTTLLLHILSLKFPKLEILVGTLLCGAVGAEIMFIYSQKFIIGHWCPICLSIASCVFIAFISLAARYVKDLSTSKEEVHMFNLFKGFGAIAIVAFGFLFSMGGFSKFNALQAMEKSIKDSIAFGNLDSPIEVYVFSDWECPSCRKIEPIIENNAPEIMKKAKLIFVDYAVHDSSVNFTPYNLSFMIHNKPQYMRLRDALTEIALTTHEPTDKQVEDAVRKLGVKYQQLNYADVATGTKYFKHLIKQFDVEGTPTVVIVNSSQKKGKKLAGASEITEKNIMNAIDALK